ncbi:hypothetical protein BCR35DRAFT_97367 [Leucosporidium creatinivorum]|uniref:Uncharacterized protein n=1 Tax=Leucosporidium creatinivorum TaxID=106004 RepID=A0A1Y2F5Z0_9BASI|nr:hypothetical protein BCR35DRAFT_97367 [Leucosporidium creatinivorum]
MFISLACRSPGLRLLPSVLYVCLSLDHSLDTGFCICTPSDSCALIRPPSLLCFGGRQELLGRSLLGGGLLERFSSLERFR